MAPITTSVRSTEPIRLNIIMVGESGVGKTSLLSKYAKKDILNREIPLCSSTVGMDLEIQSIIIDGKNVNLCVWDTSGQERYSSLCPQYFRDAHGVVLVYDITDRGTFNKLSKWWDDIRRYGLENTVVIIVGNKIDLENRAVTRKEGFQFATLRGSLFLEITATEREGISHMYEKLVKKILTHHVCYPKPDVVN